MYRPYRIERDATGRTLVRDSLTGCLCLTLSPAEARDLAQHFLALDAAQCWVDTNGPTPDVPGPTVPVDPEPWRL
jgi:hypothetical protein